MSGIGDTVQLTALQVDALFLLMGENPLPNWVAAHTLLKSGGTPYLVHTRRTQPQAQQLAAVLATVSGWQPAQLVDLGDAQAEASVIRQKIGAIAQFLPARVGMNYTGGTKAMAVHAYQVLAEIQPQAVFSYLDSNTLELMIDNLYGPSLRFPVSPRLELADLFRLHGLHWRPSQPPRHEPSLPEAAAQLARLHQLPNGGQVWRRWCNRQLRSLTKGANQRWLPESALQQVSPLEIQSLPEPFQAVLQVHLGATATQLSLGMAQKQGFDSVTQVCEWLDGVWLEHYTLAQVQQVLPQWAGHGAAMSFAIEEPTQPARRWPKFEFDVAFMRHYQLFALSCTTSSSRGVCKQKLIEANLRARQLGGAEARVGLVCGHGYPDSLRSELEVATRNRKIAVFGRSDWGQLGEKIAEWVKQNG